MRYFPVINNKDDKQNIADTITFPNPQAVTQLNFGPCSSAAGGSSWTRYCRLI